MTVGLWATTAAPAVAGCPGAHARLREGNADRVRKATLCVINRKRADAGLGDLEMDGRLVRAATTHSEDMVARDYFDHNGPLGDTVITRALKAGYLTGTELRWQLAENLATGTGSLGTAAGIVRQWMQSPPHRANLMLPDARDAGIGLLRGRPGAKGGATFTLDLGFTR